MFRAITIKFVCDYGAVYCSRILEHCSRILEQCSRIQRKNLGIKPQKSPAELAKDLGSELADPPVENPAEK